MLSQALHLTRGAGASTWATSCGRRALIGLLTELAVDPRSQVLMATHSPVLAAVPGATVLQLDEQGLSPTSWQDLDMVDHYRRFLDSPPRYL